MKNAFIYSLKAWFTTLLIAPLIGFAIQKYKGGCHYCDYIEYFWTLVGEVLGFFLLLPVIMFLVFFIIQKKHTTKSERVLIISTGTLLTLFYATIIEIIIYLYKGITMESYAWILIATYGLLMAICLRFYKLPKSNILN